jgi:hypothetical protein
MSSFFVDHQNVMSAIFSLLCIQHLVPTHFFLSPCARFVSCLIGLKVLSLPWQSFCFVSKSVEIGAMIQSLIAVLMAIVMTLHSCIYYSSAFFISPPIFASSHVMQRSCRVFIDNGPSRRTRLVALSASSSFDDDESQPNKQEDMELPDYDKEEILLKINLALHPGVSTQDALQSVATYSQSFPFAAVLPVQPLTYLPTPDGNGVEIKFLRKKTSEKSAVDGGIRFFVKEIQPETTTTPVGGGDGTPTTSSLDSSGNDAAEEEVEDEDEEVCITDSSGKCIATGGSIEITAKRNSVGQTIRKLTAERLVVTAFVAGITGEEVEKYGRPPIDQVYVTSVFHKWLL